MKPVPDWEKLVEDLKENKEVPCVEAEKDIILAKMLETVEKNMGRPKETHRYETSFSVYHDFLEAQKPRIRTVAEGAPHGDMIYGLPLNPNTHIPKDHILLIDTERITVNGDILTPKLQCVGKVIRTCSMCDHPESMHEDGGKQFCSLHCKLKHNRKKNKEGEYAEK